MLLTVWTKFSEWTELSAGIKVGEVAVFSVQIKGEPGVREQETVCELDEKGLSTQAGMIGRHMGGHK